MLILQLPYDLHVYSSDSNDSSILVVFNLILLIEENKLASRNYILLLYKLEKVINLVIKKKVEYSALYTFSIMHISHTVLITA